MAIQNLLNITKSTSHGAVSKKIKKTTFAYQCILGKNTAPPEFSLEQRIVQWKLALPAKEKVNLDELLQNPPALVVYPDEPVYEEQVEGHTQQSES